MHGAGNGAGERLQTAGAWPAMDAMEGEEQSRAIRTGKIDLLQRSGIAEKLMYCCLLAWVQRSQEPLAQSCLHWKKPGCIAETAMGVASSVPWTGTEGFHRALMNYNGSKSDPSSLPWG